MKFIPLINRRILLSLFFFSGSLLFFSSCEKSALNIDQLREVCFDTEVLPIMQNSCATSNCHDVSAADGYRLDSYNGILAGISPGNPDKSKIYQAITTVYGERMPPSQPLSKVARMIIRVWIEQGAVLTICKDSIPIDTSVVPWTNPNVCFERDILPVMVSSCGISGCHDPITMEEEFNFTNFTGILDGVNPGNPGASKVYKSITEDEASDIMPPPPYSPLTQTQIDSIYRWILIGAPNEDCGDACDTINVTYNTHLAALVATSCKGCHSGSSPQGNVSLENYSDLVASVNTGAVPSVLREANGYSLMPPFNSLSECNISAFEIWIRNGMPE